MFLGYESFFRVAGLKKYDAIPAPVRYLLGGVAAALPYSAYGKNWLHAISRLNPLERYFEVCYPGHYFRRRLQQDKWFRPFREDALRGELAWALPEGITDPPRQAVYFEATAKLAGDMLVKVDRMSMAHSIEVRSPLMDHVLAELAYSLPAEWHMRGGRGKALFLRAVGDRLPAGLLTLPKRGFAVPLAHWFRGPLREFLRDHLTGTSFRQRGFTEPAFVDYLIEEHQSGRRDNSARLWELLMLELWFRGWQKESDS